MTARGFVTLLPALLAPCGCRQVLDVDDFGTKPKAYVGATDGYEYTSRACRDCVDEHCHEEAGNCEGDPFCKPRARCLARCAVTDHVCRGRCAMSTPSSPTMAALIACQAERCGESLSEADRCGGSLALQGNASCDQCRTRTDDCRSALVSLSKNAKAVEYQRCRDVCTCHGECSEGAPGCECEFDEDVQAQTTTVESCCTTSACQQTEPDWSCIGHVESPKNPASPLDLHMLVVGTDLPKGVPMVDVHTCSTTTPPAPALGDLPCAPAPAATTDAEGWAHLIVPEPSFEAPYFGYLLLRVDDEDPAPSAPALFHFFPPVYQTPTWLVRRIVTRSSAEGVLRDHAPDISADWEHRGGIVFSARSCHPKPASGLRLTTSSKSEVLYFDDQFLVDRNATETSSLGVGFLANVPEGQVVLTATLANGTLVGTYPVTVAKGALTHVVIGPTELEDQNAGR